MLISGCNFFNISGSCIEVILDRFYLPIEEIDSSKIDVPSVDSENPMYLKNTVLIRNCRITTCETGVLLHSYSSLSQSLGLKVYIIKNEIVNSIKNGMVLENLFVEELEVIDNKITSSGFSGAIIINCHASKKINIQTCHFFDNLKIGLCMENSSAKVQNCKFTHSVTGI